MTEDSKKYEVVGRAVYLEFIKPGQVQQFLLMPEGIAAAASPGQLQSRVPVTLLKRRLTISAPKRTWRSFAMGSVMNPNNEPKALMCSTEQLDKAKAALKHADQFFNGLIGNAWAVQNNKILVVEVTAEDLLDVRRGKTPYKVLGRIMKCRRANGFPQLVKPLPVRTI